MDNILDKEEKLEIKNKFWFYFMGTLRLLFPSICFYTILDNYLNQIQFDENQSLSYSQIITYFLIGIVIIYQIIQGYYAYKLKHFLSKKFIAYSIIILLILSFNIGHLIYIGFDLDNIPVFSIHALVIFVLTILILIDDFRLFFVYPKSAS